MVQSFLVLAALVASSFSSTVSRSRRWTSVSAVNLRTELKPVRRTEGAQHRWTLLDQRLPKQPKEAAENPTYEGNTFETQNRKAAALSQKKEDADDMGWFYFDEAACEQHTENMDSCNIRYNVMSSHGDEDGRNNQWSKLIGNESRKSLIGEGHEGTVSLVMFERESRDGIREKLELHTFVGNSDCSRDQCAIALKEPTVLVDANGGTPVREGLIQMLAYKAAPEFVAPVYFTIAAGKYQGREKKGDIGFKYINGSTSLQQYLRSSPHISFDEMVSFAAMLGKTILSLHRSHIAHHDIKEGNILLRNATTLRDGIILIDFGLATTDVAQLKAEVTGANRHRGMTEAQWRQAVDVCGDHICGLSSRAPTDVAASTARQPATGPEELPASGVQGAKAAGGRSTDLWEIETFYDILAVGVYKRIHAGPQIDFLSFGEILRTLRGQTLCNSIGPLLRNTSGLMGDINDNASRQARLQLKVCESEFFKGKHRKKFKRLSDLPPCVIENHAYVISFCTLLEEFIQGILDAVRADFETKAQADKLDSDIQKNTFYNFIESAMSE